ncbi:hypothetical protein [Paenibacillus pabuli]|uniref:hypothetical protein n=1 Tax=Paenibacillus pabuli TaxID=1472 RepID=UPI0020001525|nr:hypothetical protein [Paenibacillus pabuli]UPK45450.1 hypothetical protein KET34_08275 [Paenibacillus pabuli]
MRLASCSGEERHDDVIVALIGVHHSCPNVMLHVLGITSSRRDAQKSLHHSTAIVMHAHADITVMHP